MTETIERHNVRDATPGESGTIPAKTELEKDVQRQLALAFKEGASWATRNHGVSKGRAFEHACTECAERKTKEVIKIIKK